MRITISTFLLISILCIETFATVPPRYSLDEPIFSPYGKRNSSAIEADSSHEYDVLLYDLEVKPYYGNNQLWGKNGITLKSNIAGLNTVFLHCSESAILSVTDENLNPLSYSIISAGLNVFLTSPAQIDDTLTIYITYTAGGSYNYYTEGFHRWNEYAFTFAEPYGARCWFPCYDLPFDKAQLEMEIWVPAGYKAGSNGQLTEIQNAGAYDIYRWEEFDPIATYLISIACGPYTEMTAFSSDSIPLLYYVYPEDSAMAEYDFAQTPQMMDYFSDTFGEYPFQMYGMAEARIFYGWGAMEHQTMTTYGDNLITGNRNFENVVAHELSHMWWGDALTPLTFADIWLNEGFATYSEALCMDHFYNNLAETMAQNAEYYFWEDQNQLRYPIYNPPSDFLFGSAVYNKGAWVQYMLEYVMGDSAFFTGWRNYFDAYRYGNVITSEYQAEMEAEYGDELDWFFQEWVYQAGFPIYDYHWEVIPSGQTYDVTFELWQIQTNAPIFSMPIALSFTFATGDTVVAIWNDQPNQIFQFEFASEPLNLAFDFDNRILKWDATLGVKSLTIAQPGSFQLEPNYPNPFNSQTRLGFSIATPGEYSLKIFNSQGELVEELLRSYLNAGEYSYIWDGDGLATGIYWEILTNGPISKANKIIMLK